MDRTAILVHPDDDMLVALRDHAAGTRVDCCGEPLTLREAIPAKHKLARRHLSAGESVRMYGITVGRIVTDVPAGGLLTTSNLVHATDHVQLGDQRAEWQAPDVDAWRDVTFQGYY
ncbi:MAG: UxaA family hydrolase, partial [Planctomycetales bacterium]|nr:UxaA family hydrolase [Planctomycetales bacterium]